MAGKSRRSKLILSDENRAELEQLSRSRTLPHREAQRAAIILGYYGGESIAGIGRRLGMTRLSVSKWVAKALAVGPMAALKDSYHRPKGSRKNNFTVLRVSGCSSKREGPCAV